MGCHFLLQCMKVKSESEVTQSCPTLRDSMDYSLPDSPTHGIFQARVLQWVAIAFSDIVMLVLPGSTTGTDPHPKPSESRPAQPGFTQSRVRSRRVFNLNAQWNFSGTPALMWSLCLYSCTRQEHWSGLPFPSPMHESEKSK